MDFVTLQRNIGRFGASKALYDLALRALNRGLFFKILKGLRVTAVDPDYLNCDDKYRFIPLDEGTLKRFAGASEYELTETFIYQALEKGDECQGILCGDRLVSYAWYSNKPTSIDPEDLVIHFDSEFKYMYKCFTHVDFRGKWLNAVGMTRALKKYRDAGYRGLIAYVESNNFSSLKSLRRIGFEDFGEIYIARFIGKYLIGSTSGCKDYRFGVEVMRPLYPPTILFGSQAGADLK
jgi:hypothetical protein